MFDRTIARARAHALARHVSAHRTPCSHARSSRQPCAYPHPSIPLECNESRQMHPHLNSAKQILQLHSYNVLLLLLLGAWAEGRDGHFKQCCTRTHVQWQWQSNQMCPADLSVFGTLCRLPFGKKMPRIRGDQLLHRAHKINVSAKSSETICKQ